MRWIAHVVGCLVLAAGGVSALGATPAVPAGAITPEQEQFFEQRIRPILADHCYNCHGPKRERAGLRLDAKALVDRGSDSGPIIVPGDADHSRLIEVIRYEGDVKMPPKTKLPAEAIEALAEWVRMGAPWPVERADPAEQREQMDASFIERLRREHWAFRPVGRPAVPGVADDGAGLKAAWVSNPIDAFVLARLDAGGLTPARRADRRTLIRRATYDLTGLPPTAEEIEAFAADDAPDAYEKLVDRLLASPRYGERWARHWLDVARYSDTKGYVFNEDRKYVYAYTYRDYVIRAFNEDKPYDRFIVEQLAADQLDLGEDQGALAAMGYLTLGRRFTNFVHDIIDDRIDVVTRGMLGLTVTCARCHDHKYDPIPTSDYYAMHGMFHGSMEPDELPLIGMAEENEAYVAYKKELDTRSRAYETFARETHEALLNEFRDKVSEYLLEAIKPRDPSLQELVSVYAPGEIRTQIVDRWHDHLLAAAGKPHPVFGPWHALMKLGDDQFAARAPEVIAELAQATGAAGRVNRLVADRLLAGPPRTRADLARAYGELLRGVHQQWQALLKAHADAAAAGKVDPPPAALPDAAAEELRQVLYAEDAPTVISSDHAAKLFIYDGSVDDKLAGLRRNVAEWEKASKAAPPRAHVLVDRPNPPASVVFVRGNPSLPGEAVQKHFLVALTGPEPPPFQKGSGRLELARAIADESNPLTARVIVNRVWMHHFGEGIVRTPSDFGTRGEPPTHPELLDWLARWFMENGWSIKKLHRLILTSSAYRQSSEDRPACRQVDPDNRLLWRMNRQRLDFEAMRDALLAASGRLDLSMGGPSVSITAPPFSGRRTVYGLIERQNLPSVFRVFDFASPDTTSPRRFTTTVPQQALFMMNSAFMAAQARRLADRAEMRQCRSDVDRVRRLYRLALGRFPEEGELTEGIRFVQEAEASPADPAPPAVWTYGCGGYDPQEKRVEGFEAFTYWTGEHWRPAEAFPDPVYTHVFLGADSGHPGSASRHAAIRRWRAPSAGLIEIDGTIGHAQEESKGNGVQAWIVSSRSGELGHWTAHSSKAETKVWNLEVEAGETIDFVVDSRGEHSFDTFTWAPVVRMIEPASPTEAAANGDKKPMRKVLRAWNAEKDFAGPPPEPLTPWEQYAQVLLMTNEFAFVD